MKKRILSLLLVVAMLAAMVVVPAYAVTGVNAEDYNNTPGGDENCPCGCGSLMKDVQWIDFNNFLNTHPDGDKIDNTGKQTGSANIYSGGHYQLTGNITSANNVDAMLRFRLSAADKFVFDLNGYTIAQTGARSSYNNAWVFYLQSTRNDCSLYILDTQGGGAVKTNSYTVPMIYFEKGNATHSLNIYGGTFEITQNPTKDGAIVSAKCPVNIYGGVFDASKVSNSARGGAFYTERATLIKDAYVVGGTASGGGDAIYANNTTLTFRGNTTVIGGIQNNGGNIDVKETVNLSELDLTVGKTAIRDCKALASGAKINVKATAGVPFTAAFEDATEAAHYAEYFTSGNKVIGWTEDTFQLVVTDEVQMEECPHCGEPVVWEEWTAAVNSATTVDGHYYLTGSQQISDNYIIGSKICLDMNGYDIGGTSNGNQLFWVNSGATLNICDLSDSGNSELKAYGNCDGGVAYISGNVNIKGGTKGISLSSSAPTPGSGTPTQQGGLLRVGGNTSVVTVENCTLTGSDYAHKNGGVLHNGGSSAQITFTNCTINGSHVSGNGGAISTATGTITLNNCTVNGGQADGYGGAIAYTSNGKLNLTNTTVVDGTATAIDGFSTDGIYHSSYGGNTITDSTVGTIYTVNNGAWITFVGTVNVDELILDNDTQSTQNAKINTESLNADSSIGLTTTGDKFGNYGKFSTAGENAAALVECFTLNTDVEGLAVIANGLDLYVDYVGVYAVDAEGNKTWYATAAEAQADANATYLEVAYLNEITLAGNATVNVNGNDLTVKGTGAVTLIDTANQDYTTYGLVSLDGVTLANTESATVAGTTYYTVQDNEGYYSFHVLDSKLTSVGLKKSTGGLYYYVTFMCDDLMAANVQYFGIKYELYDAEGANKIGDTIYGVVGGELLTEDGTAGNKVEIAMGSMNNIVNGKNNDKAGLTTEEMGALKIKATPFACVYGELPAEGEPDLANDVVAFGTEQFKSMYDIFAGVNALCADSTYAALSAQMYQLLFVDWAGYDLDAWRAEFTNFAAAA